MNRRQWLMHSKIGPLFLVASDKGLQTIFWTKQNAPMADSLSNTEPSVSHLKQAVRELEEFFKGERRSFSVSLDVIGTDFQKTVWKELEKIPYGETVSYIEIARRLGKEKAVRAVGTANGRNPLSIIVPCHRVIASNGALTGYSGGLEIKSKLLDLERGNTI